MSQKRWLIAGACLVGWAISLVHAQAPGKPGSADAWYGKTAKIAFSTVKSPDGRFAVDCPKKDWMTLAGGGPVVLTMAQRKGEAVVVIEHARLNQALAPSDITDLFAQLEAEAIKEREPKAADFQSRVIEAPDRRVVVVQYSRPGISGQERVRQYSITSGKHLFRLTCVAAASAYAAFEPFFAHVVASFTVAPEVE
jgi:hypothetical protein